MSSESLCEPLRHPSIELPLKLGSSLLTSKAPGYSRGAVMQSLTAATVMASALARGTCFSSARFILPLGLSPRTTAAGLGLLDQYQRFSSQPSQSWLSKLRAADESDTSTLLRLLRPRHLKGLSEAAQKAALMRVLRASYVMGAADIAVEALGLLERRGAALSPGHYESALAAFTRAENCRGAEALEFLRSRVPSPMLTTRHLNWLMRNAAHRGDTSTVSRAVDLLTSRGLRADSTTYVALLESAAAGADPPAEGISEVDKVWQQMLRAEERGDAVVGRPGGGRVPNALQSHATHCARVSALSRLAVRAYQGASSHGNGARDRSAATDLMKAAVAALSEFFGWDAALETQQPAEDARDRILKATAQAMQAARVLDDSGSFEEIVGLANRAGFDPDIRVCNQMLAFGNRNGVSPQGIKSMIRDVIKATGQQPDKDSFVALVMAHAQRGDVEGALHQLELAAKRGLAMTCHAYDPVLRALARAGRFHEADEVYQVMKGRNVIPDAFTFHALFQSASRATKMMPRPLRHSQQQSGAGEHDWHAQNLADFYRQLEPASDLLVVWAKDMKAAGIPRQAFLSEMLLQALGNLGHWKPMVAELHAAKAEGTQLPRRAYNHAIHILAKFGKLGRAQALRKEMEDMGMKSDAVTFTSLLRGCLASEDGVREASKVMEQMRRSEAVPDMRLYNRAMEVHLQHGDVEGAKKLLAEAESSGLKADYWTWFVMAGEASRLSHEGLLQMAVPKAAALSRSPHKYTPPPGYVARKVGSGAVDAG